VVEVAVEEEEGVILRRGLLVLCPFGGEEYCGVSDPFGPNLHQHPPLPFIDARGRGKKGK
jgi:hypothetical protein